MSGKEVYRIGFIVEQVLGHVTHGQNLRTYVGQASDIEAEWALPAWNMGGLAGKLPVYRSNWTVHAGWQARRAVARMQRQARLDALFFHTQVTAVLASDWLRRIPAVVSLDATPLQYDVLGAYYDHDTGPDWLEQIKYRLNRHCFHTARHLVTWSAWAKKGLIDKYGVPAEKITVIPPGVDTAEWAPPEPRHNHTDSVRILFVGGNLERKGGHLLLEAFRQLRQEGHALELHMVTRDPVAPEPDLFIYNDMQPNSQQLKDLYHQCDIFALPTSGDALPMVLSEAGAAGLPIVSTWVAAIPEIVEDGVTGFLIDPGDVRELTSSLRQLVVDGDLRCRQGTQMAVRVRRDYDAGRNARQLLELLKDIADSGTSAGN